MFHGDQSPCHMDGFSNWKRSSAASSAAILANFANVGSLSLVSKPRHYEEAFTVSDVLRASKARM